MTLDHKAPNIYTRRDREGLATVHYHVNHFWLSAVGQYFRICTTVGDLDLHRSQRGGESRASSQNRAWLRFKLESDHLYWSCCIFVNSVLHISQNWDDNLSQPSVQSKFLNACDLEKSNRVWSRIQPGLDGLPTRLCSESWLYSLRLSQSIAKKVENETWCLLWSM